MAYTASYANINGGAVGNIVSPATELGGKYKVVVGQATPDAATGNITLSNWTTIAYVVASFAGTLTANCYSLDVAVDGTNKNQINFELWKAGGTAADTAFLPVNFIAIVS